MQILRFEDAPEVAPKRKKSSAGWIGLGLVAALFGVSTAFASGTIAINGTTNSTIDLGQGVVTVSGCDSDIGFKPNTTLNTLSTGFVVSEVIIGHDYSDVNNDGLIDTAACDGKQLKISFYADIKDETGAVTGRTQLTCANLLNSGDGLIKGSDRPTGIARIGEPVSLIKTAFKCEAGSIYLQIVKDENSTIKIEWAKNKIVDEVADYPLLASAFDHVTIESVSDENNLSVYAPAPE